MVEPHALNVWTHVAAGAAGLMIGAIVLFSVKGGPTHRRFGRVFVWIGAVVLTTAVIADALFKPPAPLVMVTLAAGYQYLSSLRALALRAREPGLLDAALALAALGGCAALFVVMGTGTRSWTPAIGYSTLGFTAAIALYDLSRFAWAKTWAAKARPLDHGLKMTGAYFAMMSGGVGNIFRDLQPWSQVGPSILGVFVMALLAGLYLTRRSRAGALQQAA